MISDIDRFFKIGFLWRKEFDLLRREEGRGDEEGMWKGLPEPVCRGP